MEWTCTACGQTIDAADSSLIAAIGWRSTNGQYECVSCVKHPPAGSERPARVAPLAPDLLPPLRQRLDR